VGGHPRGGYLRDAPPQGIEESDMAGPSDTLKGVHDYPLPYAYTGNQKEKKRLEKIVSIWPKPGKRVKQSDGCQD
jgi:hypothetical protein